MKKTISFVLVMMILVSVFSVVPAFASTDMVTYEHIDISGAATGKFWVNIKDSNERTKNNYSQTGFTDRHYDTDFFVDSDYWEVVVQWPASFYTANYAPTGTLSEANTLNPVITSKTGISYRMPTKTSTFVNGKESINIMSTGVAYEIPIGNQYEQISFLTASACLGTTSNPKKTMTVKVKYEGEEAIATPITNEPVLGRTAYNTVDNFVGVLSTLGVANGGTSFGTNNGTNKLALYEYTIGVDKTKVVESIIVTVNWIGSGNRTTFSIPAITGMRDWTETIAEADAAIIAAAEDTSDVEKVLNAVAAVNEIKKVGMEMHLANLELFDQLFADSSFTEQLIGGVFSDNTVVDWENVEKQLGQTKSIIDSIGYDAFTDSAKNMLYTALDNIVCDLLESEEEDDIKKGRFETLKNADIYVLSEILYERVMWVEESNQYIDSEWIYFELTFSQDIDPDKLNDDYLVVKCGEKTVPSELIRYDVVDDKTIAVKIANSLMYEAHYRLYVSDEFNGKEKGQCVYEAQYTETLSAPVELSKDGIIIEGNTISGSFSIVNSQDVSQPFVLTVAFYDESGKLLEAPNFGDVALAGKTKGCSVNLTIPEKTNEILCYIMDSYTSANLLAPVCILK